MSPPCSSWARTDRAEWDLSPVLTPQWHPLLGKEGVYDQLFDRIDACFTQFKSAGSVGLCLLLPQDGIFSNIFPSLTLWSPISYSDCWVSVFTKPALWSQITQCKVAGGGCLLLGTVRSDKQSRRINSDISCPAFMHVFISHALLLKFLCALQPLLQVKISQCSFRGMAWCIYFKKRSLVHPLKIAQVGVMPCLAVGTEQPEQSPDSLWKNLPNPECHHLALWSYLRTNWIIDWKSVWADLYKQIRSARLKKPQVSPFPSPSSTPAASGGRTTGDRVKAKCVNPVHYSLSSGKISLPV